MTAMSVNMVNSDTAIALPAPVAVTVASVLIPADHRKHHASAVAALAENIETHGLRQPIEVVRQGNGFRLVFGSLRLQAHQHLGRPVIPAVVKEESEFVSEASMRLASIAENKFRSTLSALDDSVAIADWCAIYRAAQPEVKRGRKPGKKNADELSADAALNSDEALEEQSAAFSATFSDAAAHFLKISRRSVFNALKIASIPAQQRDRIALHPIADNTGDLYALAQIGDPDRQNAVIDLILSED